jgi:glycosyltransferase involved in cell wall biosynthesis
VPDDPFDLNGMKGKHLLAPSKFAAKLWGKQLHQAIGRMPAVYPSAEPIFSEIERPQYTPHQPPRILFAGRLSPDKGIYTLLASLHVGSLRGREFELTVTTAGDHNDDGQLIKPLLDAHPKVNVVPACRTPKEMAALMADHDVVVVPSSDIFWKEIFGMVSVEAQHAGCRVVVSDAGGLPETDCGGLVLIKPDDPLSLANGITRAIALGPLTEAERLFAGTKFTVAKSVDKLLSIIEATNHKYETRRSFQKKGALVREQFDYTLRGITQFGGGMTREQKLAYRR